MKMLTSHKMVCFFALIVLLTPLAQLQAGQAMRGISGDWQVNVDYKGQPIASILSISQDKEGKLAGKWISFWGVSELTDIKREGKELNFAWSARFGNSESRMSFEGLIERGKLSGVLSSDSDEFDVEGKRLRRVPMVMGNWDTKVKMDDREFMSTLVVKADEEGKLTAQWWSERGELEITDVQYERGKLSFKMKPRKGEDRQWESNFQGTVKGHTLSGTITSERGDIKAKGKRVGAALVGQWQLEIASDSGSRKQLLRINPDLSGILGPIAIKKVNLDNDKVAFKTVLEFGEQKYEISFAGQLNDRKLTGELTTSRGTQKVTGQKIRWSPAKQRSRQTRKPSRKPDVIFVPTPQEAVDKMLELAEVKKDDLLYDLGCGDGIIVVTAAKRFGCKAVGYDIDPERVRESLENVEKYEVGHLVRIEQKDIFTLDLSEANVITLYLLPSLNVKLIPQLEKLKPGSRIVSHDFRMKGIKPDKVVKLTSNDDYEEHKVFLWTTPLRMRKKKGPAPIENDSF